ncbi:acyl-CoA carboxylase subunit epsilon [Actinoalloteichus caeruleus]|uniref:Acyl-CoA carboxylase epsilon subunit n=1 Tax=Actinoalloteichus caeruleus DSM 43889 TaxID=1120930 RepID=A0ABT1JMT6_ACTCY|nr:acyl-CoA carboxylase subunit epsilon [Actinoalloteichus caeruleus]MCP2333662.1 Acyl-CoA carboxylase epsilon subunit [Actinoalloteichus caeruleus DSM 43889]
MSTNDEGQPARPLLRIVRGSPDDVELAALTSVVASLASAGPAEGGRRERSPWAERSASFRQPLSPGPGAWRRSTLPRG